MLTTLATTLAGHLRVASIAVAAALLGAGGAVASVATVSDSTPTADPGVVVSTLEAAAEHGEAEDEAEAAEPAETAVVLTATTVPPVLYDPQACTDAVNHGAYVSLVAHATKGTPDHGALVSAAAQSDCGKADKAEKAVAKAEKKAARAATKAAKKAAKAEKKAAKAAAKAAGTAAKKEGNRGTLSGTSDHGKSAGKAKGQAKRSR